MRHYAAIQSVASHSGGGGVCRFNPNLYSWVHLQLTYGLIPDALGVPLYYQPAPDLWPKIRQYIRDARRFPEGFDWMPTWT